MERQQTLTSRRIKIITMSLFFRYCSTLAACLSGVIRLSGRCVAWLLPVMVLVTSAVVLQRLVFSGGSIAAQETVTYLHATIIMVASAYTLAANGHVRVDIFYRHYSPLQKAWVDVLGTIFFLLPLALFSFLLSYDYVMAAWQIREGSADAGGIGAVFLLKTLILVNAGLLAVQAVADLLNNVLTITYRDP